jgi:peptide/nickel transport system substrate-binding protein
MQTKGGRRRRPRSRWAAPVVAAMAGALAVAGCTGDGHRVSGPPSKPAAFSVADAHRQAPAAPVPGAHRGGVVTVLAEPLFGATDPVLKGTLDPTEAFDPWTDSILSGLVTRSLTQYVYDQADKSVVLVPDIATDTGTPNADFTKWTFTIRDGVRFENGAKVTAADVAYGIKRSFDSNDFPGSPFYSREYFLGGDTYDGPYGTGTSYDGVGVAGNRLTITMSRPFPDMPYFATFPSMGPIRELGSGPGSYGRHPLATGPYKFAHYVPGRSLTLVRNPYWDPSTDPGRHDYPDGYAFDFTNSAAQADATILGRSPRAQTSLSIINVQPADLARARALHRLSRGPRPCTHIAYPDNRKIRDIRVREAIGYAWPYRADAELSGNIFGVTALHGSSALPIGFPGRLDYDIVPPGHTDPNKARALLRQAGYQPGQYRLRFPYNANDPDSVAYTDMLVSSLTAAGFKVTPFRTSSGDELGSVDGDPNAPINLRVGTGWCPDWLSGNAMLTPVFQSGVESNSEFFSEPSVDKEIARISRLPLDQQPSEWGALDKTIMTKYYPIVVTDYPGTAQLHGPRIGGSEIENVTGQPTWKDLYVRRRALR